MSPGARTGEGVYVGYALLIFGNQLLLADTGNHRVLVFEGQ
jgi:hypothetical protein